MPFHPGCQHVQDSEHPFALLSMLSTFSGFWVSNCPCIHVVNIPLILSILLPFYPRCQHFHDSGHPIALLSRLPTFPGFWASECPFNHVANISRILSIRLPVYPRCQQVLGIQLPIYSHCQQFWSSDCLGFSTPSTQFRCTLLPEHVKNPAASTRNNKLI